MILDMFDLKGKIAMVTGARTGLGQGMATGLAEAGADLAIVNHSPMPETDKIIKALGRRSLTIEAELSDMSAIQGVVEKTLEEFGRIDILVNNAGTIRRAPSLDFSEKDWNDVMDLNLKSVFFLSQAAAKAMVKQGGGKIINIYKLN